MKRMLPGVALLALLAGCGSQAASTRLKIEVGDARGVRAFRLTCGPPGGTAPHPAAICASLRKNPKLLVGGPVLDHSCPSGDREFFQVSGRYLGYPIQAAFPPSECALVPGQDEAAGDWSYLMDDAGAGVAENELGRAPRTEADRRRARRLQALRVQARRLRVQRQVALKTGALRLGRSPDRAALQYFRDSSQGGPELFSAEVFTTTRKKLGPEILYGSQADTPVYLLVLHYAYRDYTGRRHRASETGFVVYDARTLAETDGGYPAPSLRRLGSPVTLSF